MRPRRVALAVALVVAVLAAVVAVRIVRGRDDPAAAGPGSTSVPAVPAAVAPGAMRITIDLDPDAVWDDGTPITATDFRCTADAFARTPGSLAPLVYTDVTAVRAGATDRQVVVDLDTVSASYKELFATLLEASKVPDCTDISGAFADGLPMSGRPYRIGSWSAAGATLVRNDAYWGTPAVASMIELAPVAGTDGGVAALRAGTADFILPPAAAGLGPSLTDPAIAQAAGAGAGFEALYFQVRNGPFADPTFRQAFSESIDRDLVVAEVYAPVEPGASRLDCGPWVPTIGPWCDPTAFQQTFQPEHAAAVLAAAGWARNADGLWARPGQPAPQVRWSINSGNTRREQTQALLIPILRSAGFDVVADNCDATCFFQQRLPDLDYDLAMYVDTAGADPSVTAAYACDAVPSSADDHRGTSATGWCSEEATTLMHRSDAELDPARRADEIHRIAHLMAEDHVLLPLHQLSNVAAWRTDRLAGPTAGDAAGPRAFAGSLATWQPLAGDTIHVGAAQWPACLNPITSCSLSAWYGWTVAFPVLPAVWDTTADGSYVTTDLVAGEPVVDVGT